MLWLSIVLQFISRFLDTIQLITPITAQVSWRRDPSRDLSIDPACASGAIMSPSVNGIGRKLMAAQLPISGPLQLLTLRGDGKLLASLELES